ncbi:hypothetical protein [Haliovirga abyssi]|uniref:Uncharacterized protein n=1 Tax=Haliovirga abyssi TaxID=2996794 RepID=A0AAU9DYJ0_9FUSO|nr:hypothetical protein [Haliovirga abyssi]BDU50510.1 hypothetical protein HLVA_10790 [Haliovirga abyssi]
MKKVVIIFFVIFNIFIFAEESSENQSKNYKNKDFIKYSLEKNVIPIYTFRKYNSSIKQNESEMKLEQNIFLNVKGEQNEIKYLINYSDKKELENQNKLQLSYKKLKLGDIKLKNNFVMKYFKNRSKIFGFFYGDSKNYILGDFSKSNIISQKIVFGENKIKTIVSKDNYIKNKYYKITNSGNIANIKDVYFNDNDKTNNEKAIMINGNYYDILKKDVDYIIFDNQYIELLNPKDGDLMVKFEDDSIIKILPSEKIYKLPKFSTPNYSVKFQNKYGEYIDENYNIYENESVLYVDNLNEDDKIIFEYYEKKEIFNINDILEGSLIVYSGNRELELNKDYFWDNTNYILSFSKNIINTNNEVEIFYKRKSEQDIQNYSLNLNYNLLNFHYDLSLEKSKKRDIIGTYINSKNFKLEAGTEIYDNNYKTNENKIKFVSDSEDLMTNSKDDFLVNGNAVVSDDYVKDKSYNFENKIKVDYSSDFKIRKKLNISSKNIKKVSFWIYGDNQNEDLTIKIGGLNEDFDNDGKLDTEDKNNNGYLDTNEDNGIDIGGNLIGKNNEKLDTEDFNNNNVIDKNEEFYSYNTKINFLGWHKLEFFIDGSKSLEKFNMVEFDIGNTSGNNSYVVLGDFKFIKYNIITNNLKNYIINEDNIIINGKDINSSFSYNFSYEKNYYKNLKISMESEDNSEVTIKINGVEKYKDIIMGVKELNLDISDLESVQDITFVTKGNLKINSIIFKDKIIDINNFFYVYYNWNDNVIELDRNSKIYHLVIKNTDMDRKYRYNIEKSDDIDKFKLESNISNSLNFTYSYEKNKDILNRSYSAFYFDSIKRIELKNEIDNKTYFLYWKYKNKKNELCGNSYYKNKEIQGENIYKYSSKNIKFKYNIKKSSYDLENNLLLNNNFDNIKFESELEYSNKKNYNYDKELINKKINNFFKIGIKREREKEYLNDKETYFFPILNYSYSKNEKESYEISLENNLTDRFINSKTSIFYKKYKIIYEYSKNITEKIDVSISYFINEQLKIKSVFDEEKDNYIKYNALFDGKYQYNKFIEILPYIKLESYNDLREKFNSYNEYQIGMETKISM